MAYHRPWTPRMTSWAALMACAAWMSCLSQALNLGSRKLTRGYRRPFASPPRYRLLDQDEGVGWQRWTLGRFSKTRKPQNHQDTAEMKFVEEQHAADESQFSKRSFVKSDKKLDKKLDRHAAVLRPAHGFDPATASTTHGTRVSSKIETDRRLIHNVEDLRRAVLDDGLELRQTQLVAKEAELAVEDVLNHQVIQLIVERAMEKSTPGNRSDNATLAISMEGGGMRGAVSAGMASAIACLGLCDVFDAVYGSSAGSVVGAYMVSRQMCVDVYTDLLPAAQRAFVCKRRLFASLAASAMDLIMPSAVGPKFGSRAIPGMNISFVLDGIMDCEKGLRPLDMRTFRENDRKQPLRIATSCVKDGKPFAKCLGTNEFFGSIDPSTSRIIPALVSSDGSRQGLFACLEASMTVPGATGPPVQLVDGNNVTMPCFDAFCFEPLPYRSAVEEGATHVLVLRSRPEGVQAKTKPGAYERGVAPIYFRSHGEGEVATFFEKGGQQYIYLEDMLTLEEGRHAGVTNDNHDGVHVPPTSILYGVEPTTNSELLSTARNDWNKAHLFPLTVPRHVPELPTLEQDKDRVLEAVRGGFAAAFDLLAPAIGLEVDQGMTGHHVSKLVFPVLDEEHAVSDETVLKRQVTVTGFPIAMPSELKRRHRKRRAIARRLRGWRTRRSRDSDGKSKAASSAKLLTRRLQEELPARERCHRTDANTLLSNLPGIQDGKFSPFTNSLHYTRSKNTIV